MAQAWFCLDRDQFPRKQCIAIVCNKWFDRIILSLIAINCATMAMFSSPLVKYMIEGECNGFENFPPGKSVSGFTTCSQLIEHKSLWAYEHWTFTFLKAQEGCHLNQALPCSISQRVDFFFLIVFTIEMLIKMLAMGLMLPKNAYLRSAWNWLDFVVVSVGYLEMSAQGLPGIKAIRLVKALRPLRSLQRIRGLRVLVQCILEALPQMINVSVFLIFMLVIFGLFGQAFFAGKLRHTCHDCSGDIDAYGNCLGEWESSGETCDAECEWNDNGTLKSACKSLGNLTYQLEQDRHNYRWSYSCRADQQCLCTSKDKLTSPWELPEWGEGEPSLDTGDRGGPLGVQKPEYGVPNYAVASPSCDYLSNPNYGITSFDSMLWAMVSLFQAISLEGWVDMMYQLMDGTSALVVIYFILLILVGALVVMNLFLAVLCNNFEMADADADNGPKDEETDPAAELEKAMKSLEHTNGCRRMCLTLMRMPKFDFFVQGCILFNTLLMCLKWVPGPSDSLSISVSGNPTWDYLETWHGVLLMSLNILLTSIFTLESLIKVTALGPALFRRDLMNVFDAFVVAFSIIEIALDLNSKADPEAMSLPLPLSVLRAFRVFRLFKLVRSITSMRKIMATLVSSLLSVVYLALLLCLVVLIFILLGMEVRPRNTRPSRLQIPLLCQPPPSLPNCLRDSSPTALRRTLPPRRAQLYSRKLSVSGNSCASFLQSPRPPRPPPLRVIASSRVLSRPAASSSPQSPHPAHRYTFKKNYINWDDANEGSRYHFDDFGSALLSIFVVLSGENWNEIMFDSHRASWDDKGAFAIIYFILLFVVGNLLLFNLFIAILLSNFEDDGDAPAKEGKQDVKYIAYEFGHYVDSTKGDKVRVSSSESEPGEKPGKNDAATKSSEKTEEKTNAVPESFPSRDQAETEARGDKSLGIFSWANPVRVFCANVVMHPYFEPVVLVLILVSTLFLVMDMPHFSEKTTLRQIMKVFNYIFTASFTIEMLLKIVSMGFCKSKTPKNFALSTPYMRDGWNVLDFFIVLVSIAAITLPTEGGAGPLLKQLRVARAVRPLRLVSRYPALKITFNTLLMSIPSMASLMSVASLFFIIFAILGLELFGGKFGHCMDPGNDLIEGDRLIVGMQEITIDGSITKINDYQECMSLSRYNITRRTTDGILLTDMADITGDRSYLKHTEFPQWLYPQFGSFDNVFMSLMLLFEVSALEAWPDVMHVAMDADSKDLFIQPYRFDSNPLSWMNSDNWTKSSTRPRPDVVTEQKHVSSNVEAAIFFVLWIVFGCFVIVNMTVGVVCDTFADIKAENDGLLLMTEEEAVRNALVRPPLQATPPRPTLTLHCLPPRAGVGRGAEDGPLATAAEARRPAKGEVA